MISPTCFRRSPMDGIILSKVLKDKHALPRQIMLYRGYVRAVFLGA